MGRSYTSRNSNSKAVHTHHEVTIYNDPNSNTNLMAHTRLDSN